MKNTKVLKGTALIIFLFLISLTLYLLFLGQNDLKKSRYDFIEHFWDAEKDNFKNEEEINKLLPDTEYSIGYLIRDKVIKTIQNAPEKILITNTNKNIRINIKPDSIIRIKISFNKNDSFEASLLDKTGQNFFEISFDANETNEISVYQYVNNLKILTDKFEYTRVNASNYTFYLLFLKDYFILYENKRMLYQQKNNSFENRDIFLMQTKSTEKKINASEISYIYPPLEIKNKIAKKMKLRYKEIPEHHFNYLTRSWNGLSPEDETSINGEKTDFVKRIKLNNETRRAILFPMNSRLIYKTNIPDDSVLRFSLSLVPKYVSNTTNIQFKVQMSSVGKNNLCREYKYYFHKYVNTNNQYNPETIDLREFSGEKCKIVFSLSYSGQDEMERDKALAILGSPLLYSRKKSEAPSVILIVLDTLRADNLGCYGYKRDTSKNIDKFAKFNVLFKNCISNSSWTLPSHMSFFTSRFPYETGYVKKEYQHYARISSKLKTLAEEFRDAGYQTYAITGGSHINSIFGFDRGFDLYYENREDIRNAVQRIKRLLAKNKPSRFFLFFQSYEIHEPYRHSFYLKQLAGTINNEKDSCIARYDSGIRYADKYIGELLDYLRNDDFENTLIILTSDHGENFNELKYDVLGNKVGTHGWTLYDSELRVPLIMQLPQKHNINKAIDEQISLVDLYPTISSICGLNYPDEIRGRDISPLIKGTKLREKLEYAEGTKTIQRFAVRDRTSKLILNIISKNGKLLETYEGYNIKEDPTESLNYYNDRPAVFYNHRMILKQYIKTIKQQKLSIDHRKIIPRMNDQNLEKDLKNLGYIN